MTDDELNQIEARAKAATPEPWNDCGEAGITQTNHVTRDVWEIPLTLADVTFSAHARTDVPALVAEVRRLRTGVRKLSALAARKCHCVGDCGYGDDEALTFCCAQQLAFERAADLFKKETP